MDVPVNYLAILVAAIVSMAVGFLWYSPALFAKPWMKLMGYTSEGLKEKQKEMGMMYGLSFVAALITAYILSHSITFAENYFGYPRLQVGLTTGFFMWLGFVAPVQMTEVLFAGKKWKLFAINTGYQLASLLAMGLVLGIM